jgi:exonuclease SbcC
MRLTRLALRNYRVYEDALELELPGGLVGIYGPNGAGKSVLLEAILFALYGRARTTIDEVRTAGVNGECLAEVEFEHEGHLYVVRRTVSGVNHTVKAEAHADGLLVTSGARDTTRFVRSTVGMDDGAFRASVFAEQKQVAAFSTKTPAERKKLVLQLLGITPLDGARDAARRDAKRIRDSFDAARRTLPDLDEKKQAVDDAVTAAEAARAAATTAAAAEAGAAADAATARDAVEALEATQREYDAFVAEGKAVRVEHELAAKEVETLTAELAELTSVEAELAALTPDADGLAAAESRLAELERVAAAEARLAKLPDVAEPPGATASVLDELASAAERAAARAEEAAATLHGATARRSAAEAELARATEAASRSGTLSGEADCPLCGQALGDAFEQVQRHRAEEAEAARERLAALDADLAGATAEARAARSAADEAAAALGAARQARQAWERATAARRDAADELAAVLSTLATPPVPGERDALLVDVARRREAARACERLRGRLARRQAVEPALDAATARVGETRGRLDALREKVKALGHEPAAVDEARTRRRVADAALDAARAEARRLDAAAAAAVAREESARVALVEAEQQHARLAELADDARHVGRVADLLQSFRNELVGEVGPRLSREAADLFAELTDREYDELQVDPDTYEIRIVDHGTPYDMDRFSGSETDLANLALRVAISEHVRFQSGGQVGLLVLDEVFGPLDDDRKERMLLALERLRARFRQVLVVTHDREIKEQLPTAIEVVKLPGRRATASLLAP